MQTTFVLCRLLIKRPSKGSNGRKRMNSGKAGPANSKRIVASLSPSLEVQAENYPIDECFETEDSDGTTSVTTTPAVECCDNNFIASAAMNQVAEMTNTEVMRKEIEFQHKTLVNFSTYLVHPRFFHQVDMQVVETNVVWTPFTSSSTEGAESDLTKASVSPASGEEVEDNHVTINQMAEPNHISDNADTITNDRVAEASDSEVRKTLMTELYILIPSVSFIYVSNIMLICRTQICSVPHQI
jgi:hypothetical protein